MMQSSLSHDSATHDLLQMRIRLRPDLVVTPQRTASGTWYQCESPTTGRFFRVGHAEYTFLSLLDGQTSLAEAISLTARVLGPAALEETQIKSLIGWLFESQLAEAEGTEAGSVAAMARRTEDRRANERLNPLWLKIPLGSPDRLVAALLPVFGWMYSVPAMLVALVLWLLAGLTLFAEWPRFAHSTRAIFHQDNWLWLSGVWVGLKLIHELSHALVCRRYGGRVRETGIVLMLLAPIAYVDVTASLAFRSKWQRMHTAAAGMFAELTLAAVAVLLWTRTDSTLVSHLLTNVIWMASLTTILFNANALMKFDGYYLLADVCEISNLATRGQEAVMRGVRRWLFGRSSSAIPETVGRRRMILIYGWAALVWRVFVSAGLLAAASMLFHGTGVLIAMGMLLLWLGRPLVRGVRGAWQLHHESPSTLWRAVSITSLGVATIAAMLWFCPWPVARTAPGFIEFRDLVNVRAKSAGFVRHIHVRDSQSVAEGDVLIELENEELQNEVVDLQLAIQQAQIRRQQHHQANQLAAAQVDAEEQLGLERRLAEKQQQADSLLIRAPISGRIMSRLLETRLGTYAAEGDELLSLGRDDQKEFRASLSQEDANSLPSDGNFSLRLPVHGTLTATVQRREPRASREPPHLAITAIAGGPLPVEQANKSAADSEPTTRQFAFLEPRVTVHFALETAAANSIPAAGTVGRVTIQRHQYSSLFDGLWQSTRRFLDDRLNPASSRNSSM